MLPSIGKNGNIVLVDKLSLRFQSIKKGNVIICTCPLEPEKTICKRVKALPRELIIKSDGNTVEIPPGHIWIEGDNLSKSRDSREFGPVPIGLIQGKVIRKVKLKCF